MNRKGKNGLFSNRRTESTGHKKRVTTTIMVAAPCITPKNQIKELELMFFNLLT